MTQRFSQRSLEQGGKMLHHSLYFYKRLTDEKSSSVITSMSDRKASPSAACPRAACAPCPQSRLLILKFSGPEAASCSRLCPRLGRQELLGRSESDERTKEQTCKSPALPALAAPSRERTGDGKSAIPAWSPPWRL